MGILDDAHRDGVVVGLRGETDSAVTRLDIDVMLLKEPDVFNLMVIAQLELMGIEQLPWMTPDAEKINPQDKFSWHQVAGIHCLPFTAWDGVGPRSLEEGEKEEEGYGYCVHSTPAFEAWHRPYLAMLEQALYVQVIKIAERYQDPEQKDKYRKAAKKFRLPYVDYFRPRGYQRMIPGVPDYDDPGHQGGLYPRWRGTSKMIKIPYDYSLPQIFTLPKILVTTPPTNELKLVRNPFFGFKFPEGLLNDEDWGYSKLDLNVPGIKAHTMRYGSNKPKSVTQMNDNLCKLQEDQLRMTLSLLDPDGPYNRFDAITNNGADGIPKDFKPNQGLVQSPMGSLEAVHNDFHVYYGGFAGTRMGRKFPDKDPDDYFSAPDTWAGHMTSVPVAAFDPVFWIHHVQIDRLFAIWQKINPKPWFGDLPDADARKLADKELRPFRSSRSGDKETFWTPNQVRDIDKLGYTYPDLVTEDQSPKGLWKDFCKRYDWGIRRQPGVKVGVHQVCPPEMEPLDMSTAQAFQFESGSTEEYLFEQLGPKHNIKQYAAALGIESLQISEKIQNEPSFAWFIDDAVERLSQNGSFTIFYIIDTESVLGNTGSDWVKMPGFVGLTHIFTAPTEACTNCAQQQADKQIVTSTTPITSLLLDYVETNRLESMKPEHVRPFLVKYLKWRVQTTNGDVVDPRDMSNAKQLRISVSHVETPPEGKHGASWKGGSNDSVAENHLDIIKEIISNADKKT